MTRPTNLSYSVDEVPPLSILIISAIQHVAVMSITLIFPLILAREANLSALETLDMISLSMMGLGIATVCFCARSRFIGSGYLSPAAYTVIFLGPSLFALRQGGLELVFGMTIVAGILQLGIAPLLKRLRALMPPEIAGLVIAILGLALASIGVEYSLGIDGGRAINPEYLPVAGASLATMCILNIWTKGYGKMFCVLIGILVGYAVSAVVGILDFESAFTVGGAEIVRLPNLSLSWSFDLYLLPPFLVATLAATFRVMGDISNAQRLNDSNWVRPSFTSLAGGVSANGIAMIFCGVVGSCGVNSYSSSVGLSGATGVTSRSVGYLIGASFVVLALLPPVAMVFVAMPRPVMGAALFFTAAFVLTNGMQIITARMLDARKIIVIGSSFSLAAVSDVYHSSLIGEMPLLLQPIFGNALVLGTVSAVLLNLVTRIGVRQRVSMDLTPGRINREAVEKFLSENGARWAARRDIVDRATFGVVQVLEVIGDPPDGVQVNASFDEFNLDILVRYRGPALDIPDTKPAPREIMASEDGERRLAGYLLRRSADRISSHRSGEMTEITLHYDH